MEDWKEHGQQTGGFFKCNKYDPKKLKKENKDSPDVNNSFLARFISQY